MGLQEKVAKGVVWSAAQYGGFRLISFSVFLILVRLLKPEEFGLVALAMIFISFIQVLIEQGLGQAIVQIHELKGEHLDTALWVNALIGTICTALVFASAEFIAISFQQPRLSPIIKCLSISIIIGAFTSVPQALIQRRLDFKSLAIRSLLSAVIGGAVGVAMAVAGYGVWSLVGQTLITNLIGLIVLWKASKWQPGFRVSAKHFKEIFIFGINIVGIEIITFINSRTDHFLIGFLLGPVALGYYTVAYRVLITMIQLLSSTIVQVAFPTFSKLQNEPERLRRTFQTAMQLCGLIAFPAFLGVMLLAPELIQALFGNEWLLSGVVLQILCFIGILHSIFSLNDALIKARGKPILILLINTVNAIVNVIAFALVYKSGIIAITAAYVIRGYLLSPLSILVVRKLIQVKILIYLKQFVPAMIGCFLMVLSVLGAKVFFNNLHNLYLLITFEVLAGILTYTFIVFIIAPEPTKKIFELGRLAGRGLFRGKA